MTVPTISDLGSLPPGVQASPAHQKIWRVLEWHARGTLLVHGSKAYGVVRGQIVDENWLIGEMVRVGTLIPIKVDLAGADHSTKAFVGLQFGSKATKYIKSEPWSTSFATLWTYEPSNRSPMPWEERPCDT